MPDPKAVQITLPLSELPSQRFKGGSMRCSDAVKEALRGALSRSGLSREIVAEELSRLTGEHIGTNQIDNWASPAKRDRRVPLEYIAALSVVLDDTSIFQAALGATGMLILSKSEVPFYELGKMTAEDKQRSQRKRALLEAVRNV